MLDVFTHFTPRPFFDKIAGLIPGHPVLKAFPQLPALLDLDVEQSGPQPIDTTAELLGRAKTRRPRTTRAAAPASTRKGTRTAAAASTRKSGSRRSSRSKKSDVDADNIGNS